MSNNSKNKLRGFIKGSFILVLSNVCLKAINFFLLPLYTNNLTPKMLGISDSITTMTCFVMPILTLGLDSAYSAFYFDKNDPSRSSKVFHTIMISFAFLGIVPMGLCLFANDFSMCLFKSNEYSYIVIWALVSVSFNLWYLPFSLELRLKNKMFLFGLSNIISSLSMIALNVLFVSFFHMGEASLVLSTMIVHIEMLGILVFMLKEFPQWEFFDFRLLRKMLIYALPLVPMTLMMWILSLSDRYMLLFYNGSEAVGIYGIALRFTNLLNVVVSAVSMSYTTFAFGTKDDENAKQMYYYVFNIEAILLLGASFTISLFGKEIIQIMTADSYAMAYKPLRDLMFAQSVYAMTTIVGYGIFFEKKSFYSLLGVSAGAFINLGFNVLLIPRFGIQAAAFTTLMGYLVYYFITLYFSKKVYPCDYGEVRVEIVLLTLYFLCLACDGFSVIIKLLIWVSCLLFIGIVFRRILKHLLFYLVRNRIQNMGE